MSRRGEHLAFKRDFDAQMCRLEWWSVRTLKGRIGGMLYERTAIARKPAEVAPEKSKENGASAFRQ